MTTRNITKKFESLRQQNRSTNLSSTRSDWEPSDGKSALLSGSNQSDSHAAHSIPFSHTLPPKWVDIVDEINEDFVKAKSAMTTLQEAQVERLRVSFDDGSEKEAKLEAAIAGVSRILKSAEGKIKKIAVMGNDDNLTQPEKIVRLNVMRHLGGELNSLSKGFRTSQKTFMDRLKAQQNVGNDFLSEVSAPDQMGTFEDALDEGLNEEQVMALREIEERADVREKEIIHLVQSINDLATLFQELNMLVIEQGTIIDRIDYNVEQSLEKFKQSNVELRKAEDYSKSTPTLKCICFFLIVILIESIILIVQHKKDEPKKRDPPPPPPPDNNPKFY